VPAPVPPPSPAPVPPSAGDRSILGRFGGQL
jgi:hypothetical protein